MGTDNNKILMEVHQKIGEMNGTMQGHIRNQETMNETMIDMHKGHYKEFKTINAGRNKVLGASIFIGAVVGLLIKFI